MSNAVRKSEVEHADLFVRWQADVVQVIRREYVDILGEVALDDIDWDAWRPLYDEGRTPEQAVSSALTRL